MILASSNTQSISFNEVIGRNGVGSLYLEKSKDPALFSTSLGVELVRLWLKGRKARKALR